MKISEASRGQRRQDRATQSAFDDILQTFSFRMEPMQNDLNYVLNEFRDRFRAKLKEQLERFKGIKASLILTVEYHNPAVQRGEPIIIHLRSTLQLIYQTNEIEEAITSMYREISTRNANSMQNASNLNVLKIHYVSVEIWRFSPLAGGHHAELPKFIAMKRAIVNVHNPDQHCFGYAIVAALHPATSHPEQYRQYLKYLQQDGLNNIEYPVKLEDIPSIEEKLNLKLNVFCFMDDEGKGRYPYYVSRRTQFRKEIDLIYWDEHFAWIKNFSRFIYDLSPKHSSKFFCKRCFGVFYSNETFDRHQEICSRPDFDNVLYTLPPPGTKLKFTNIQNQLKSSFVIYADFECLLCTAEQQPNAGERSKTTLYQKHTPCAVGFYIVPAVEGLFRTRFETYTGEDVVKWFLQRMLTIRDEILTILQNQQAIIMSADDWHAFHAAKTCWICTQPFDPRKMEEKVRDHDHLSGKFRLAAHVICNLKLHKSFKIPVFLHNFRGYDGHLIALATEQFPNIQLNIIGQGYEKYLTLGFSKSITFKDSYQFLAYSLEQLAKDLLKSGADRFINLKKEFSQISPECLTLLLRKGVFPYDYMNGWDKLKETRLPPREEFFSILKQEECSPEDYEHAQNIWKKFGCNTMKDYQDLYLKTDVLLLADVFENFRILSMKNYRVDPAHYVSSPQLSWDAMQLYTKCELTLISDPEMFRMIDRGIRGGVAMITHRYAKANNPEMGRDFKPDQELSYIVYLDANNLYGWAMSQSLPYGEFKWLSEDEWSQIDWRKLEDNDPIGYFLEVDLDYPKALHDLHNDYPLAPDKRLLQYEMLNESQLQILVHYSVPKSSLKQQKLIPHLLPRMNYVIHYRNLRFYLEEGMELKKIHRVIQFQQAAWLSPYILMNQQLRAAATTDFEKNQPKLYVNSIYGKTCENQKKRSDIRLANNKKKCKRLCDKPHMRGFRIFSENLAAIDLRRVYAKINKPFYIGFAVLELSKLHMYRFHYRYIRKVFGGRAQLLFTDTDSLMYHIHGENPYAKFWGDLGEFFDFASFAKDHKYYDAQNNKVIGKFKDEAAGFQITEFVGLRPKMYSFLMNRPDQPEKHVAKGIQYAMAKKLTHAAYLDQLENPHENRQANRRIGAKLHRLYSIKTEKRGLCSFDDKRVLLQDGISTMAYGHYQVTGARMMIGVPANEERTVAVTIAGSNPAAEILKKPKRPTEVLSAPAAIDSDESESDADSE